MAKVSKNVARVPGQTYDREVRISPSELVSLLGSFHQRLNGLFEEMRTIPRSIVRQKAGNSGSLTSEEPPIRSRALRVRRPQNVASQYGDEGSGTS